MLKIFMIVGAILSISVCSYVAKHPVYNYAGPAAFLLSLLLTIKSVQLIKEEKQKEKK